MDNLFYKESLPIRCDCGRQPVILRGAQLLVFLRRIDGWQPDWDNKVEYFAHCSGRICGWSEFTLRGPGEEVETFLARAYKEGVIPLPIPQRQDARTFYTTTMEDPLE
jgi:hypothetical protein